MRINHNISALKANNQLLKTNKLLDSSLTKLSSGYRINSAADDSAGLAISEKMRTQIAGLDQASRNASDGISVIQTAEGALQEVESMLQRMRELGIQSSNGTNTAKDRAAIQSEIDQLNDEVKRISSTTEFNTMKLLDGSIDRKSYSNNSKVNLVSLSDSVEVGDYKLNITRDARQAAVAGTQIPSFGNDVSGNAYTTLTRTVSASEAGTIDINGETVKIEAGDSVEAVYEKLRDAGDKVGVKVFATAMPLAVSKTNNVDLAGYTSTQLNAGDALVFVSNGYGSEEKIELNCSSASLGTLLGLSSTKVTANGVDAVATLNTTSPSLFQKTATISAKGNKLTVSDRDGFKMTFEVEPGTVGTTFTDKLTDGTNATLTDDTNPADLAKAATTVSVLDAGPMDLQIGANDGQTMSVSIPKVTPETLGIDDINVGTADGAEKAVSMLDDAINTVSAIRSKLGAYQNRLEHSISNLDTSSQNMTESISRIEDVDMAEEMANYTQKQVLSQAGTSMLAQANKRPQEILSLLQQ